VSAPVRLRGGVYDVARRDALRAELAAVELHGDVVLDLGATEFMDCSCLGVLTSKLRAWRDRDPWINVRLRNVPVLLARILRVLRLDEVFTLESLRAD
jgi:anti-anti-sigma factor